MPYTKCKICDTKVQEGGLSGFYCNTCKGHVKHVEITSLTVIQLTDVDDPTQEITGLAWPPMSDLVIACARHSVIAKVMLGRNPNELRIQHVLLM